MSGSIHKTPNGRFYIAIYRDGKHHKIWNDPVNQEPFYSEQRANYWLNALRAEITAQKEAFNIRTWKPDNPLKLNLYAEQWLKVINVSNKTWKDYRTALRKHIIPELGDRDIRKIRLHELNLLYKKLQLSEKGKANTMGVLKSMLRYAWKNGDLPNQVPFPKLPYQQSDVEYLTLEQQERVLEAIPERHRPVFQFMMEYGTRVGEGRALKKDCIRDGLVIIKRAFSENELREITKTRLVRTEDITSYFQRVLDSIEPHLGDFVFVRDDGLPYTNKNLNKIWKEACREVGIEIKLYNACRHSHASQLLDAGYDIKVVQEALGHADIRTTMRYTRRANAKMKGIRESLRDKIQDFPNASSRNDHGTS